MSNIIEDVIEVPLSEEEIEEIRKLEEEKQLEEEAAMINEEDEKEIEGGKKINLCDNYLTLFI